MSVLDSINQAVKTRLEAQDYFDGVTIITEDQGDIDTAISVALARLGSCLFVLHATADCTKPNVPGPYLNNISVVVQAAENVVINRRGDTYKTALDLLEHALYYLHLFKPTTINECFTCAEEAIRIADPPPGASVAYNGKIITSGGIRLAE